MRADRLRKEAREWAEALAGCLAAVALVVVGCSLPELLGAAHPLLPDAVGGLCVLAGLGGVAWFLSRG